MKLIKKWTNDISMRDTLTNNTDIDYIDRQEILVQT